MRLHVKSTGSFTSQLTRGHRHKTTSVSVLHGCYKRLLFKGGRRHNHNSLITLFNFSSIKENDAFDNTH